MARHPVGWRQLCAIASAQLSSDPHVDWFEWAERIKCRLVRLGLGYPDPPQQLTAAMEAAHHVYEKHWGPRRIGPPRPSPARQERANLDPPWARYKRQSTGFVSVASMVTILSSSSGCAPPFGASSRPSAREAAGERAPVREPDVRRA